MRTRRWAYIGSLLLVMLVSPRASAQSGEAAAQRASEWQRAGEVAFAQGRFGDALDAFEASYRKRQQAQTLRRIGDAADKLGSHVRAAEALQAYLKDVPDAPDRDYIASRINANQLALGPTHPRSLSVVAAPLTVASEQQRGHNSVNAAPALAITQPAPTKSEGARSEPAGPIWLWAAGGAVVVAGIVIAAVLVSSGGSRVMGDPVQGNVGSAIQTLGSR